VHSVGTRGLRVWITCDVPIPCPRILSQTL